MASLGVGWDKRREDFENSRRSARPIRALGPALGGLRMWNYQTEQEALTDVLRLSKGMTYKSACASTGLGGGKAVIIGNQETDRTEERFRAMGRFIETLGGRYITAEDVGIGICELDCLAEQNRQH